MYRRASEFLTRKKVVDLRTSLFAPPYVTVKQVGGKHDATRGSRCFLTNSVPKSGDLPVRESWCTGCPDFISVHWWSQDCCDHVMDRESLFSRTAFDSHVEIQHFVNSVCNRNPPHHVASSPDHTKTIATGVWSPFASTAKGGACLLAACLHVARHETAPCPCYSLQSPISLLTITITIFRKYIQFSVYWYFCSYRLHEAHPLGGLFPLIAQELFNNI